MAQLLVTHQPIILLRFAYEKHSPLLLSPGGGGSSPAPAAMEPMLGTSTVTPDTIPSESEKTSKNAELTVGQRVKDLDDATRVSAMLESHSMRSQLTLVDWNGNDKVAVQLLASQQQESS